MKAYQLSLGYEPIPENAALFAADIVANAAKLGYPTLDYSPASLETVDGIVESFRQDGLTVERIASILFYFGCYVGEVFVRNGHGTWISKEGTGMQDLAVSPIVLERGLDHFTNPVDKVFKRMENGEIDSLPFFYKAFTD
jgi:hypothetical protein